MIAQIKTSSELTSSYWGDEHMYFRHERMENDLLMYPEWKEFTPKYKGFFGSEEHDHAIVESETLLGEKFTVRCPFAMLFNLLQ